MEIEFPYSNEESRTLGNLRIGRFVSSEKSSISQIVKRPRMVMRIFSKTKDIWIQIKKTLVDTGADTTLVPRFIGELMVEDTRKIPFGNFGAQFLPEAEIRVTTGKYGEMSGIVPGSVLVVYIHKLKIKVGDREFEAPVAIADSNNVPSIIGRVKALDLFDANFFMGKTTKLKW